MLSATISVLFSLQHVFGSTDHSSWSYADQGAWANLDHSFCGASAYKTQSPIAIQSSQASNQCPSDNKLDWQLVKDIPNFLVTNQGNIHVQLSTSDGEGSNDAYGKLKNNFKDAYGSDHGDYCLDSLHVHWPSEHTIDGHRSALEIHFVHFSCNYDTLAEAVSASVSDKNKYVLAVVGVLYEEGDENSFLNKITDRITELQSYGSQITLTTGSDGVNINDIVPEITDESEYYHYRGSLTTPLCNPIVNWHILKQKMSVSTSQLAKLATIINAENTAVIENFRDIDTFGITNTNPVYSCKKN